MTDDMMNLRALVEKSPDADLLREMRRMAEKALTAVIQEAYVQGISTRSVDVKAMGMSGISKSQVSRLCEEIGRSRATGHICGSMPPT